MGYLLLYLCKIVHMHKLTYLWMSFCI